MRISLIGASTYQIVALIDALYSFTDFENADVDFFLVGGFYNSDKWYQGLKKCTRFSNVYYIEKGESNNPKHYLDLCHELLFSALSSLRHITHDKHNNFIYDAIVCENYFPVATFLRIINVNAKFYIVEDGVAPYYYSMNKYLYQTYIKRRDVYKKIGKDYPDFRYDGIFCYDPEYVNEVQNGDILCIKLSMLNQLDIQFWDIIDDVFSYNGKSEYADYSIIIIDSHGVNQEAEYFMQNLLQFSRETIVRPHPRKTGKEYPLFNVDRVLSPWEVICADCITDNHIIVGNYSTAQFVPKMLYDKEPWIIFTWSMNQLLRDSDDNSQVVKHIDHLKGIYRNPNKVMLVDDSQMLSEYITGIMR